MRDWDIAPIKPPSGAGQVILYLDFDGVLHHESVYFNKKGPYIKTNSAGWGQCPYVLFQYAPLLVELLAPYPAVKIVLSTSWARVYGCYGAVKRLPFEINGYCGVRYMKLLTAFFLASNFCAARFLEILWVSISDIQSLVSVLR